MDDRLVRLLGHVAERYSNRGRNFEEMVNEWRRCLLWAALDRAQGNQCQAAADLGIHRNTLNRWMRALDIHVQHYSQRRRPQIGKPDDGPIYR